MGEKYTGEKTLTKDNFFYYGNQTCSPSKVQFRLDKNINKAFSQVIPSLRVYYTTTKILPESTKNNTLFQVKIKDGCQYTRSNI